MNDCPNADVRDLLPDLIHGRLDEATRVMVESHVAGCADCRDELELLGTFRSSTGWTPSLNVAAITAAIPAYRAPVRRSWVGWRTAAAVTLIVGAGSSIVVTQRIGTHEPDSSTVIAKAVAPMQPAPTVPNPAPVTAPSAPEIPAGATTGPQEVPKIAKVVPPAPVAADRELAMSGGTLTDLSDRELASLLKDIESLDAVPSTDVESVPIAPIAPQRGRP